MKEEIRKDLERSVAAADEAEEQREQPKAKPRRERPEQPGLFDRELERAWDDPDWSLLDDRRGSLPTFPMEALPESLHDWIDRAARGSGTTVAHIAAPLIGIASSLIGTARRIRASRSWSQPATLWCALVGFSGTGKTPGIDATRKAVGHIEYARRDKIAELRRQHETRAQAAKVAKKEWESQVEAAIKQGQPPPPKPNIAMDVGEFVQQRLCVSDATVERVAVLLEASPRGMTYVADELSRLFLNMSRYSSGQDNEFWLEAWNGGHYTVERQSRPAVVLEHLLVGLIGGFQPGKLAKSFENEADGMYARMLFAWPEEPAYQPLTNEVDEIEPAILNALTRIIELDDNNEDGIFAPKYIDLSDEAVEAFEQFRQFLHEAKAAFDGREREWRAKGGAHVLRLTLTLAYIDWAMRGGAEPSSIDFRFMTSAVHLWCEYFWPHSRAALRQIGLTERHGNARRVLKWIRAHQKSEVSREDLRRDALAQQLDAGQTQILIDGTLVRGGWLRDATKKRGGPGRRANRWEVNPQLFGDPPAGIAQIAENGGKDGLRSETAAFSVDPRSPKPGCGNGGQIAENAEGAISAIPINFRNPVPDFGNCSEIAENGGNEEGNTNSRNLRNSRKPDAQINGHPCRQCGQDDGTTMLHAVDGEEVWLHAKCEAAWLKRDNAPALDVPLFLRQRNGTATI